MTTSLQLTAAGLVTALGLDADTTIASLRAGLDAFRRMPFAGPSGRDLQAAPIVGFAEAVSGIDRYEALAERALQACLVGLSIAERADLAIFLGLPLAHRPGVPDGLADTLPGRLAAKLGLSPSAIVPLGLGRAAVFAGLSKARQLLQGRLASACLVGGVDILTNGHSLRGLSQAGLLKDDFDGFIPGEAAAFVRVQAGDTSPGPWGVPASRITGLGAAREAAAGTADDPLTGKAVCAALREACRQAQAADTDFHLHINDVNGSRAAFEDNAMGRTRFFRAPNHPYQVWHIASHLGETGAASGGLQLAWAAAALDLGFAPGPGILLSGSDAHVRTAAVVQPATPPALALGAGRAGRTVSRHGRAAVQPSPHADSHVPPLPAPTRSAGEPLHVDLARRHRQELAWLWQMRERHHLGESPWAGIASCEERLWPHLDALAWAGPSECEHAVAALQSDDPHTRAAAMLVLLSHPLESGLAAPLFELAAQSEPHLATLARVLPHLSPAIARPLLSRLATSPEARFNQAGLRAMLASRQVDPGLACAQLSSPSQATAALAIQAAASVGLTVLADLAASRVAREESIAQAGLTRIALLALGLPASTTPALEAARLARESPVAAALMCLRDRRSFLTLLPLPGPLDVASIDACGWAGEVDATPCLMDLLDDPDDARRQAVGKALHRIYGLVPPGDPGEVPPGRAPWQAQLQRAGLPTSGTACLRHGQPWSSASAMAHLHRPECAHQERLIAAWEHAVLHRRGLPLHPGQFVAAQRESLEG